MPTKKIKFQTLIFALFCIFCFVQNNIFHHWTENADQDFTLIYNALLINSGFKPEYFDHPGYTQILFLSYIIDLLNFFNISNIGDLESIYDKNFSIKEFNYLFFSLKISNLIILFLISIFLNYLFFKVTQKKNLSFLLTLFFLYLCSYHIYLDRIRTELGSFLFLLIFISLFIKFIDLKKINKYNIFFSGFFFALGIFAKMQIIFCLPLLLILLITNKGTFENKAKIVYFDRLFIFFYLLILIFIVFFFSEGYFNKIFTLSFGLVALLFFLYLGKKKLNSFILGARFYFFFLSGFILIIIFFLIAKPFHLFYFKVLANFPGWMTMFVVPTGNHQVHFSVFKNIFYKILNQFDIFFYKIYFSDKILFAYIVLNILTALWLYFKKKIRGENFKIIISIFCYFFLLCIIFSLRINQNYFLYSTLILFFSTLYLIKNSNFFEKFNIDYFSILFVIFLLINSYDKIKPYIIGESFLKPEVNTRAYNEHCLTENIKKNGTYMKIWHKRINEKDLFKLCKL